MAVKVTVENEGYAEDTAEFDSGETFQVSSSGDLYVYDVSNETVAVFHHDHWYSAEIIPNQVMIVDGQEELDHDMLRVP